MKRKSLSKAQRVKIFDAANGVCYLCGVKIHAERGEQWDVEHEKPLWLGGEDAPENMKPAHVGCHKVKSNAEAPIRAKTDRMRARHIGVKSKKKSWGYGKNDKYKMKVGGKLVLR